MALRRGNVAGVWMLRPQATCTGSIPSSSCYVPSRSHCRAGLPADGGGCTWHWPSLAGLPPMFCSQFGMSWDAELGSLGRHWCHPLDLIAGQVSPSFQLGTRQAPSPSCCQSRSVWVCPSSGSQEPCSWELGGFLGGGGSPSPSAGGPWACL